MPTYLPGEVIRDKGGYVVVAHFPDRPPLVQELSIEASIDWRGGKLSAERFLGIVANHLEIVSAYESGSELPEGAYVVQEEANPLAALEHSALDMVS